MGLREHTFDTGELAINFGEGAPTGPPNVLLHGMTGWWPDFEAVIEVLEQEWHVYALDLRGHGRSARSPVTPHGYRVVDFVRDALAFVQGVISPAERIALLGFSLGGLAALGVGAALPDRVGAVVAYDPALFLRDSSVRDDLISEWMTWVRDTLLASKTNDDLRAACRIRMPELDDAALQRWTLRLSLLDPAVADLAELDRLLEGLDLERVLRSVRCPTLILRGRPELGSLMRDDDAEWAAARLAHGTIEQIRGAGHDIHNEQAGAVMASTRAFLRAARSAWSSEALPGPS